MHAEAYLKILALAVALTVMPATLADPGELVSVTYGDITPASKQLTLYTAAA
jgi:hypothetical protein